MMADIAFFLSLAALSTQGYGYKWTNEGSDSPGQVNMPQLMPPPTNPTRVQGSYVNEQFNLGSAVENLNTCPTKVCGVQPFDEKTGHKTGSFIPICTCSGGLQCQENALSFSLQSYKTYVCAPLYSVSSDPQSSTTNDCRDL